MPKEILNPDPKLSMEFQRLVDDQDRKIAPEDQKRKTLWAIDALIQDKEITRETPFKDVLKIVRRRISDLKKTQFYGKRAREGRVGDEMGAELHDIAGEEVEKAEKFLSYLEMAERVLTWMNTPDFDQELQLGYIQDKLKSELKKMEEIVEQAEIKSRN